MSNCDCHPEMISDGSGRLSRYLRALDPTYAPLDDRSLEELMTFIKGYATRIRFYDVPESKIADGVPPEKVSWENFFKTDVAVIAAAVMQSDTQVMKKSFEATRMALESAPDAGKLADMFTAAVSIASRINEWYKRSDSGNPLHQDLGLLIQSVLATQLQQIIAYEEGFKLINPQHPMNLAYGDLDDNPLWGTDKPIAADATIYEAATPEEKILNAALYGEQIFTCLLTSLETVVNKGEDYLQFALERYPAHQPHMALFIAFLKLFQLAQQQMNGLTGRLLDYYYKEVLALTPKEALPDKVHVVFELAKNVMQFDLEKDTLLKAGKDDAGVDQMYATTDDLVINQARIKEIKTVFIEKAVEAEGESIIEAIYADPVANSADGLGKPFAREEDIKWRTFGDNTEIPVRESRICRSIRQFNEEGQTTNYAMPGFAIASPQLVLGGGNRLVLIESDGIQTLLRQLQKTGPAEPLTIWLSAEKGWLKISRSIKEEQMANLLDGNVFTTDSGINEPVYALLRRGLAVFLPVSSEAVVAFNADLHQGYRYNTSSPVLQIMLNPGFNISETLFSSLTFTHIALNVKVGSISSGKMDPQMDGLQSLILQNDEQILTPGKAFNPFTFLPARGKSLYIGSEEIFDKPLTQLSINIRTTQQDANPEVSLFMLRNKRWDLMSSGKEKTTFDYHDLSQGILEPYLKNNELKALDRQPIVHLTAWDPSVLKGFVRLDNQTSFRSNEFSANLPPQEVASLFEIKELSVSYTAELEALEQGTDQFFHVYPFGVMEIAILNKAPDEPTVKAASAKEAKRKISAVNQPDLVNRHLQTTREFYPGTPAIRVSDPVNAQNRLLPQFTFTNLYDVPSTQDAEVLNRISGRKKLSTPKLFNALSQRSARNSINQYTGNIQEEGLLYIGIENINPLQSVSMLFQFAEGSARDEDSDPPPINWSYLSANQWLPLPGENLVSDGTYGFQTTGIIKVSMPSEATDDNTIITSGLRWLRASVTENANRIPMLISIVTQAVMAAFKDNHNSSDHYKEALSAGSISKLKVAVSQVSKVMQPFASFDGKPREIGKEFYTRVSERLRHKRRAVTAWDYEHLILDRFPSVYKVKCITHTDPNCLCRKQSDAGGNETICCGPQVAPGHVLLVPVANLKNRNGVDPLQPKTARIVLVDMVNYIKKLTSPFVKVYAKNPVYEQIIVFFRVQFIHGTDTGYYLKKLNDEIVRYLTPWAFDEDADVIFGQKVYASSVINFIEERPYVDFITDFEMGVCKSDCCPVDDSGEDDRNDEAVDIINRFSNCDDVETFLSQNVEDAGQIVATPSTARSILVSAPHHIIIPYEAPPEVSPCEHNRLQGAGPGVAKAGTNSAVLKEAAVKAKERSVAEKSTKTLETKSTGEITKAAEEKKSAVKKATAKLASAKKGKTAANKSASSKSSNKKNKNSSKSG